MAQEELDLETRLELLDIELKEIGKLIAELSATTEAITKIIEGNN